MAKRRLMIEVHCGKQRCKQCEYMDGEVYSSCEVFDGTTLDLDTKGRPVRATACLDSEMADKCDAPWMPSDDMIESWRELANSVQQLYSGPVALAAANALRAAVDTVVAQKEVA